MSGVVTRSAARQLEVRLREGRKRQIRRMFALFGHAVLRLRRIRFGPIALDGVASGTWRELTPAEIRALRVAVGLQGAGAGERK